MYLNSQNSCIDALRNDPNRVKSLHISKSISVHEGCVNTIHLDESGQFLLSGSDDRNIAITNLYDYYDHQVVFKRSLGAKSNILAVKFIPNTNSKVVISGFKCGCVIKTNVDSLAEQNDHLFSHKYSVYDILTFKEFNSSFATISHDSTLQFFDYRERNPDLGRSLCSRSCFPSLQQNSDNGFLKNGLCFTSPITAGDVHPIKDHRCIALASADGFVKFYDYRFLYKRDSERTPNHFGLVRPLGLLPDGKAWSRVDYGKFHITGVTFEPISNSNVKSALKDSLINNLIGRETLPTPPLEVIPFESTQILVNHMYSSMYIYDLKHLEGERDSQYEAATCPVDEAVADDNAPSDSMIDNGPENRGLQRFLIGDVSSNCSQTQKISIDFLKREIIEKQLQTCPRYQQVATYTGIRSQNTVIKNCCFWGNNYIMSGSECGHVIIWNRHTRQPVSSFRGDQHVVNKILPHPIFPILFACGIDKSIKVIESAQSFDLDEEELEKRERIAIKLSQINDEHNQSTFSKYQNLSLIVPRFGLSQLRRQFIIRLLHSNMLRRQENREANPAD